MFFKDVMQYLIREKAFCESFTYYLEKKTLSKGRNYSKNIGRTSSPFILPARVFIGYNSDSPGDIKQT